MIADAGAHDRTRAHFMADRSISVSLEFVERRTRAQFLTKKNWLFGPDPDPAYDRAKGWKLDQFAMHFVPNLLQGYKRAMAKIHPHATSGDPFERSEEHTSELQS